LVKRIKPQRVRNYNPTRLSLDGMADLAYFDMPNIEDAFRLKHYVYWECKRFI